MVAIDESMKPVEIPQFEPVSEEDKGMWARAQSAREAMR